MANKTTIIIDYDAGDDGIIEIGSNGSLTEDENVQAMSVQGKVELLRICKLLDRFLRDNDIGEIQFKEEAE